MRPSRPPRLLYLVTEDWYFWSHRLPMARAARDAGFEVAVATRVNRHGSRIEAEGFRLIPLSWSRRSLNPLREIAAIAALIAMYRRERPDIVHHVAIKPTLYGALAARLTGVPAVVNALAGMGYVFTAKGWRTRLLRKPLRLAFRFLLNRNHSRLLLQNRDDRAAFEGSGLIDGDRIAVIRGSGVDIRYFPVLPEPANGPVTVATATRMLDFKGVADLVAAFRLLRERGVEASLLLAGAPDRENPAAIPESRIRSWGQETGIFWLGHIEDVRDVWRRAHIAAFVPHGGEGLPKTLLEAAACGRPIVATDVPGCREIARAGGNALLVPPKAPEALAAALERLIHDAALRHRFGVASRQIVLSDLSADAVGARTVELYLSLLHETQAPDPAAAAAARIS